MLEIVIPDRDNLWDESKNQLVKLKGARIQLEHSLISLKKWERIHKKPFLDTKNKTYSETIDYIKCMTITSNVDDRIYNFIPVDEIKRVVAYIEDPMTATWFSDGINIPSLGKNEIVTAEIIYYWMITLNIPQEYQKWHLNELMTLIKVISVKNGTKEKVPKSEELSKRAALNAARKKKYKTKG